MWAVLSVVERGRTGEVSRMVEAGRGTEEKTPRPGRREVWLVRCLGSRY